MDPFLSGITDHTRQESADSGLSLSSNHYSVSHTPDLLATMDDSMDCISGKYSFSSVSVPLIYRKYIIMVYKTAYNVEDIYNNWKLITGGFRELRKTKQNKERKKAPFPYYLHERMDSCCWLGSAPTIIRCYS